ncbi:MAG: zinc ribbon domain-containing protein [Rhodobacterales bacterium]|nr:zinc ribbon domain-containing protein [Rhodobacterales bacterium]
MDRTADNTPANTSANTSGARLTAQVARDDLRPLVVDRLGLACHGRSPLAPALAGYAPGNRRLSAAAESLAEDLATALSILARPQLVMGNRTGGGSLGLSFFSACHAPAEGGDAWAVVTPSFEGSFLIELFDDAWAFLAWWLTLNASAAEEPTANHMPPPLTLESAVYLLHAIDSHRRCALESLLAYAPRNTPSVSPAAFKETLAASIRGGDLRWLLPAFLGLTPGLDLDAFDNDPRHLEDLARRGFLVDGAVAGGEDLVFGEAGRAMGTEFHRGWFQAAGFETTVGDGPRWDTLHQAFLAPTVLANHLFLVHRDGAGHPMVNHQALTRTDLEDRMAGLMRDALDAVAKAAPVEEETADTSPAEAPRPAAASVCGSCGAALKPDQKFCTQCGTPVPAGCPSCGAPRVAGANFCSACGAALQG